MTQLYFRQVQALYHKKGFGSDAKFRMRELSKLFWDLGGSGEGQRLVGRNRLQKITEYEFKVCSANFRTAPLARSSLAPGGDLALQVRKR